MSNPRMMTLTEEQDLKTLVRKVYTVPERGASRLVEEAIRAIQEANPHLDIERPLPAGMTILLPDIGRPQPEPAAVPTAFSRLHRLPELVTAALNEARQTGAESRDRAVNEAKETLDIAHSRVFTAAVSEAEFLPRVEMIVAESQAVLESADAETQDQEENIRELTEALAEFVRAAGLPDGRG